MGTQGVTADNCMLQAGLNREAFTEMSQARQLCGVDTLLQQKPVVGEFVGRAVRKTILC